MEERTYLLTKERESLWKKELIDAILVIGGFTFIILIFMTIINLLIGVQYDYLYIIRKSNDDFDGIKRDVCLVDYFKKIPYGKPDIGYEYIKNVTMEVSPVYTLEFLSDMEDITIHWRNNNNISGIKYDFNNNRKILIAWDYEEIPKLAKLLGCKNCNSWSINPISNVTDSSLFDIVWVLKRGRYVNILWRIIYMDIKLITISFDLKESDITIKKPITDNMTMRDKLMNFECISNSEYIVKEW